MKKVVFIARSFREADLRDIEQNISMTPAQRQRAARLIKRRLFGTNRPDVRNTRAVIVNKRSVSRNKDREDLIYLESAANKQKK